jgi:biopolymer transport protein ExbD
MASLDTGGDEGKKGPGVKKPKKLNTRVDMTPMVDLGFLLITFFIFTATMSSPTTMDLNMPKDTDKDKKDQETKVKMSGALQILLGKGNSVFYYEGELKPDGSNFKSSSIKDIRAEIMKKKKEVVDKYVPNPDCEAKAKADKKPIDDCKQQDFFVIIKPTDDASYKNVVDILDEMTINKVARYALVPPAESELQAVHATEQASGIK